MKTVIGRQVKVFTPPFLGWIRAHLLKESFPNLARICHSLGGMLDAALCADSQTIRQSVPCIAQHFRFHVAHGDIHTPQISCVLILGRSFFCSHHHTPLHPSGRWAWNTGQAISPHRHHFVQPSDTPQNRQIRRRTTWIQIQAGARRGKRYAILIQQRHIMPVVELQPPFVFSGYMSTSLPPVAVFNVVVNDSTVDQCPLLLLLVGATIPLAARHIISTCNER